jgi:hypothetical protein
MRRGEGGEGRGEENKRPWSTFMLGGTKIQAISTLGLLAMVTRYIVYSR